jgi:hypothetical protein
VAQRTFVHFSKEDVRLDPNAVGLIARATQKSADHRPLIRNSSMEKA